MSEELCSICKGEHTNDGMVACDRCGLWFHYDCVDVDDSVKDVDWFCESCEKIIQDMVQKRVDAVKAALEKKIAQATIDETQNAESTMAPSTSNGSILSTEMNASTTDNPSEKNKVLPTDGNSNVTNTDGEDKTMSSPSKLREIARLKEEMECRRKLKQEEAQLELEFIKTKYKVMDRSSIDLTVGDINPSSATYKTNFDKTADALKLEALARHTAPTHKMGEYQQSFQTTIKYNNNVYSQPITEQQRLARKSMGDDLPMFSGNILEWPLFLANFEESTKMCGYTDLENRKRLDKCLLPPARNYVNCLLVFPQNVSVIIDTLKMKYGKPHMVVDAMLDHVEKLAPVPRDKFERLIDFSISVNNLCSMIDACGEKSHFENTIFIRKLTSKLPPDLCKEWAIYKETLNAANLISLNSWLQHQAVIASKTMEVAAIQSGSNLFEASSSQRRSDIRPNLKSTVHRGTINAHSVSQPDVPKESQKYTPSCRMCKIEGHTVSMCDAFVKLNIDERWKFVRDTRLCSQCLRAHPTNRCYQRRVCGTDGCLRKHHRLLHAATRLEVPNADDHQSPKSIENSRNCNTHSARCSALLFKILPVTLYGPKTTMKTYAFLDDGSSVTLLDREVADVLGLEGPSHDLCLTWTGEVSRNEQDSKRVTVHISGQDGVKYKMNGVRTVSKLDLPTQSVNFERTATPKYLRNMKLEMYENAVPKILIGIDQANLNLPLRVCEGCDGFPSAIKTRLGWVIFGPTNNPDEASILHHRVEKCECQESDEILHQAVKDYFSIETAGIVFKPPESKEDARARIIMESTTKRLEGCNRYETGLLWRFDTIDMPNSFPMALRRLECLESKMKKDPDLAANLSKQIEEYLTNNYARKMTREESLNITCRTWILPIFTVRNANKPSKIRLVWDAAASIQGISLNRMLIKGPDLLCSLMEILFRFRQKQVAMCGDIKHMFHQVFIREQDQESQRFIWRDGDSSREPDHYIMQVMTFGASCSPSSAQFVKNMNAEEHRKAYPRAAEAIVSNHYVDDYLDSVDTEAEAINLANDVIKVHSYAGFHIRNWLSNSKMVQEALEGTMDEEHKDLDAPNVPDKILGMWWDTKKDTFCFKLNYARIDPKIISGERRPTKRELLRTLMCVYDPLGLIAFLLINIKVLLQDVWRAGIGWDEPLTDSLYDRWKMWSQMLTYVTDLAIPRCYSLKPMDKPSVQLHLFADASEAAYATVAYFRVSDGYTTTVSLIGAKTKVAPLHPVSIPRLELQAAVLSARFEKTILSGHTIEINDVIFWSDSEVVLRWLRSDMKRYKQYVALRVGEIIESTDVRKWRWVPTKLNVADDATKWTPNSRVDGNSRWFTGPEFLYASSETWPVEKMNKKEPDEELKVQHLLHKSKDVSNIFVPDATRVSHWRKLVHAQVYVYRYVRVLRKRVRFRKDNPNAELPKLKLNGISYDNLDPPSSEEFAWAELIIIRHIQNDHFSEEMTLLDHNEDTPIPKSSPISKFSPYIDEDRILRHRGRIDAAYGIPQDAKRPIILPRKSAYTRLLVFAYHCKFCHANKETVINEIRQRFLIPKIRVILNDVQSKCQQCKVNRAKPRPPQMGDLPQARLSSYTLPFTYTGMDFFGPMEVAIGRRTEKRWGVIFTCLTVRGVHIELADSLSTDACIICIRNFVARRGQPKEIYSDNGTNMRGADTELQEALRCIDQKKLKSELGAIDWKFIPPASPHMGGSWERLIQSIKKTFKAILPTRKPTETLLRTMLIEAESIVNTRPLTHVAVDPDEPTALTPNHFLLGSSSGTKPMGQFTDKDLVLRKNWRKSQRFSELFWQRWTREYLPTLIQREKWREKVNPIKEGDLVIIFDDRERNSWQRGVVVSAELGSGGQVRTVVVRTTKGLYTRPATKVAVLDVAKDE